MKSLGLPAINNLKAIRISAGYTQKQVAALLGLKCEDRLSHWERGSAMPSTVNLLKLLKIYGINIQDVYGSTVVHTKP